MDQKRLILAIAISLAILLGFQWLMPRPPHPVTTAQTTGETAPGQNASNENPAAPGAAPLPPAAVAKTAAPPREVPRLKISAPRVLGSISLVGARLDDIVLRDYRETTDPTS